MAAMARPRRLVLALLFLQLLVAAVYGGSCGDYDVEELTGDNFAAKVVVKGSKPALVEFYLSSCPHCKNFIKTYDCIANELDPEGFMVARIVATLPEVDAYSSYVPTLRYFPSGVSNAGIVYHGERTQEAIVAWIKQLATTPISDVAKAHPESFAFTFKQTTEHSGASAEAHARAVVPVRSTASAQPATLESEAGTCDKDDKDHKDGDEPAAAAAERLAAAASTLSRGKARADRSRSRNRNRSPITANPAGARVPSSRRHVM